MGRFIILFGRKLNLPPPPSLNKKKRVREAAESYFYGGPATKRGRGKTGHEENKNFFVPNLKQNIFYFKIFLFLVTKIQNAV